VREELRLRMFENRVLRRIAEPNRGAITGKCRRVHNEERYDLYNSPNVMWVIKTKMRWVRQGARKGERKGAYRIVVG
jgi:hypothetical protein